MEGNSGQLKWQTRLYHMLASTSSVKTVCETVYNALYLAMTDLSTGIMLLLPERQLAPLRQWRQICRIWVCQVDVIIHKKNHIPSIHRDSEQGTAHFLG